MTKIATFLLISLLFVTSFSNRTSAQTTAKPSAAQTSSPSVIESGKFRFYETKQIRGEETYEITRSATGELLLTAKTDMPFAEQENKPLVNVTLRTSADFTPRAFQIKGPTLLDIEENTSVVIQGPAAKIQDRGRDTSETVPKNFFVMSGYVPVAVEMMLVRYWLKPGQPKSNQLLQIGDTFVQLTRKSTISNPR